MAVLRRLEVEHLAILEGLAVEFGPGLNVLSGETGAGKSLLIDALQLALGGRADSGLIRQGESRLRVAALFEVEDAGVAARLDELGVSAEDGCVLLQREVARDNRGTCRLNGRLTSAAALREAGQALLALLGQGEQHRFAQSQGQAEFLDAYAGAGSVRQAVGAAHARWLAAKAARESAGPEGPERERRRALLAQTVAEIDALGAAPDEEERLAGRRAQLANAQRLMEAAGAALGALWEGEGAARDRLGAAARELAAAARLDPGVVPALQLLEQAAIALDEAGRCLRRYRDDLPFEPAEAAALEARWTEIQRCKRRYGDSLAEVLAQRAAAAAELADMDSSVLRAEAAAAEVARRGAELGALCAELGALREAAAARLGAEVAAGLGELGLGGARLEVALTRRADADGVPVGAERLACTERGCEAVGLLWAANAGESPQPLGRTASGGELARLLLCLHTLIPVAPGSGPADGAPPPTLVFDEIDAGVGGRAAAAVAARLQSLATRRQVLCVTHQALVAAAADRHFAIEKAERDGRTGTAIHPLEAEARIAEVARMLDGGRGATSRQHALEMLRGFARPSAAAVEAAEVEAAASASQPSAASAARPSAAGAGPAPASAARPSA